MNILAISIALLGGAVLPLQSLLNARLGRSLSGPTWAGAVSALVSAAVLLMLSPIFSGTPSVGQAARQLPGWMWLGGALGAIYLIGAIYSVRVLGAASMVACSLLGQLLGAMVMDTVGVLGSPVALTWQRVAGCSLAAMGVLLLAQRG